MSSLKRILIPMADGRRLHLSYDALHQRYEEMRFLSDEEQPEPDTSYFRETSKHTIIPQRFSDRDAGEISLKVSYHLSDNEQIERMSLPEADADCVYAIAQDQNQGYKSLFGSWIELISDQYKGISYGHLHLHFRTGGWLDIAGFQPSGLQMANSFPYKSSEEVLYFAANAAQQSGLQLTDIDTKVYISGETDPDQPVFDLLRKYIRNIVIEGLPIRFSYAPDFIPAGNLFPVHRFFQYLSAGCVL